MRQPSGDPSAVAPPVPIPNTEVKRCSPDDSASLGCAKVGRRQSLRPVSWKQEAGPFCLQFFRWIFVALEPCDMRKGRSVLSLSKGLRVSKRPASRRMGEGLKSGARIQKFAPWRLRARRSPNGWEPNLLQCVSESAEVAAYGTNGGWLLGEPSISVICGLGLGSAFFGKKLVLRGKARFGSPMSNSLPRLQ